MLNYKFWFIIVLFAVGKELSGQIFNGKLIYKLEENYTKKRYEDFLLLHHLKNKKVNENDYIFSLKKYIIYHICGDTLIKLYLSDNLDTITTAIQIRNEVFIGRPEYFKFNLKSEFNKIKNFKKIKSKEKILVDGAPMYECSTSDKSSKFKFLTDSTKIFLNQLNNGYLFGDILTIYGLIVQLQNTHIPSNTQSKVILEEILLEKCNCTNILNKIDFLFVKNMEEITLDKLLNKNGKDSTLIDITERQQIEIKLYDKGDKIFSIDSFKGHYTLIDLWATWCQPCLYAMPSLADLEDKYRYHGLKVISISFDGETAKDKWKNTIERENMYWDNYIMPEGFESDLSRQLGIKAIPHYILLDPDGRIMLENAPGPSDPMLHDVLDRVLKGRK